MTRWVLLSLSWFWLVPGAVSAQPAQPAQPHLAGGGEGAWRATDGERAGWQVGGWVLGTGLAVGITAGAIAVAGHNCQKDGFGCLGDALLAGMLTLPLWVPLSATGVQLAGDAVGGQGVFWATMLGSAAGLGVGVLILAGGAAADNGFESHPELGVVVGAAALAAFALGPILAYHWSDAARRRRSAGEGGLSLSLAPSLSPAGGLRGVSAGLRGSF